MKTVEFDEECQSCGGTGLYSGMAEGEGFAVVCHTCKGTGKHHFVHKYEPFGKRKERKGIKRVIQTGVGIGVGLGGGKYNLEFFGGLPYSEWKNGAKFTCGTEMRNFTCPAWWYQSADYKKKPDWKECWDTLGSSFSQCKHFKTKSLCWKRFDKEQKEK